ncbi:CHASE2 domain-containing protein [Hydrogenophaga sp.]|uniref:CHASE2 domain-containing protein n=1 Tax=Hydrogenophaga sp. TaxID=1904254 RepID=UPI0025C1ABE7|nr:CHASE2 domain-containing protein [Hydrogenophaga sp.]
MAARQLEGKIVLVGSSAPGLFDLRATPAGAATPGVETHANLIAGLLDGTLKHRPDCALGYEWAQFTGAGCHRDRHWDGHRSDVRR